MIKQVVTLIVLTLLGARVLASDFTVGVAVWGGYPESVQGFKDGLAMAGIAEGEGVTFIYGQVGADAGIQRRVAEEFNQQSVDLVYSLTTPGTVIVKQLLPPTVPIVFSIVTYPADSGLIESFEYSGNNLVGTSNYIPIRHYLALLKRILPSTKRVAIFHRKGEPNSKIQASSMLRLLKREGIVGIDVEPETIEQLREMAKALVGKVDVFITTTDTLMQSGGESILIDISLKHEIPILSSNKKGIEQGATFGPVADFYTLGKMAGAKAAQILLHGAEPTMLASELQDPPLFLANKKSINLLGIALSKETQKILNWVK